MKTEVLITSMTESSASVGVPLSGNCQPSRIFLKKFLLQYSWFTTLCFMCIAYWFSYTYTSTYSFSDSFPTYVITEYWVEFPVLSSRSLLANYFICSSLRMLIQSSWFIISLLPHISPLVTISLFLKSVSLFLFCK